MTQRTASGGMRNFLLIWFGQLISLTGSGLTAFALGVWIYQRTGSVTLLAINMLAFALPQVVLSPVAGALVDRWDRRIAMIISDLGAGLSVLAVALLFLSGRLEPWNIYIATFFMSSFQTLQWPAWSAATTLLVPKEQLGRASGMVQMAEAAAQLAAPAIAGALFVIIGLGGLVAIDFASYLFAVVTMLFFVRVPRPEKSAESQAAKESLWSEIKFGWTYITARSGLLGLLLFFATTNFLGGTIQPLFSPLILDTWSPDVLGYLGSIMGVGMLVGTVVISAWGGPKRRIYGILGANALGGLFIMLVGLRPSIPLLAVGGFGILFTMPIANACSQAIWQSKVAPDVQGRVFSVRRMIAWSTSPVAMIVAAPLADNVFKPLLIEGGPLAASVGQIVGVGPGRGIGLQIIVMGALMIVATLAPLLLSRIRRVELELPDAVASQPAPADEEMGLEAVPVPAK